ncbi:MAG: hypothetical protein ACFB0B_06310 [Thermonemataceae bacterium]
MRKKFVEGVLSYINDNHRPEMRDISKGISKADWVIDLTLLYIDKECIQVKGIDGNG